MDKISVHIKGVTSLAEGVRGVCLEATTSDSLPPFSPGAHINLETPVGTRPYSLTNSLFEGTPNEYWIAVGLHADRLGVSRWIHHELKAADELKISPPRNGFPLVPGAERYYFLAGGIGITPIYSMVQWCIAHGRPWELVYAARSRRAAAFYASLRGLGSVAFHMDDEHGGHPLDVGALTWRPAPGSHFYCCGPEGLMAAAHRRFADWPEDRMHFETFTPKQTDPVAEHGFQVILRRSGRQLAIPPNKSILQILEQNGVAVPCACRAGICGSCETKVFSGTIEHRDSLLSEAERKAQNTMMLCVSRASSPELVLDL